ncbi:hypothetical protein FQN51_000117 [Onygenales sp. PD_10]|nr:hypothetical protein FQN51_000117 [Onygenales sp. PD_10]
MPRPMDLILRPLKALRYQPWPHPSAIAPLIDPSQLVEEENSPFYNSAYFYPARLGEVLNDRYQIVTKLGHGSRATVWLARDLHQWRFLRERYVAVKVNSNNNHTRKATGDDEVEILRHISKNNPRHEGWHFVRKLRDSFPAQGVSGSHACLVFEPLRESLGRYCKRWQDGVMPSEVFKVVLQMVLQAVDYLHSECHVIHTDLKPDNIMMKLEDNELLDRDARDEFFENPLPQKQSEDGRTIYLSRRNYGAPKSIYAIVEITDFDLSVRGDGPYQHSGCIQAEVYRAPEVIVDAGFTYSADIWSLGVMLWDFLEGRTLFEPVDPHKVAEYDDEKHLAYITALLGPAPKDLLDGGKRTSMFYSPDGTLKNKDLIPEDFTFEGTLSHIGGEEKRRFINFVRRMVKWKPEERSTAKELLSDPWLHEDFPQE